MFEDDGYAMDHGPKEDDFIEEPDDGPAYSTTDGISNYADDFSTDDENDELPTLETEPPEYTGDITIAKREPHKSADASKEVQGRSTGDRSSFSEIVREWMVDSWKEHSAELKSRRELEKLLERAEETDENEVTENPQTNIAPPTE